ncbi:MAG TPA: RDD family protein [Holophagaceae bacterium]|nr:RDD family protein [Holophagaceae bacterium]
MNGYEAFQAPGARLEDDEAAVQLNLASRGARLGASLLDGVIAGGTIGVVAAISIPLGNRSVAFISMGLAILGLVALNLFLLHKHGQSLGKRIVGIRIVRNDGRRASLGRIVGLRILPVAALRFIPLIGPFTALLDVLFIFRDSRKCLHDDLAGTLVVDA